MGMAPINWAAATATEPTGGFVTISMAFDGRIAIEIVDGLEAGTGEPIFIPDTSIATRLILRPPTVWPRRFYWPRMPRPPVPPLAPQRCGPRRWWRDYPRRRDP